MSLLVIDTKPHRGKSGVVGVFPDATARAIVEAFNRHRANHDWATHSTDFQAVPLPQEGVVQEDYRTIFPYVIPRSLEGVRS